MPVNSTHPDYDAVLSAWNRARDVLAGEDAVKAAGVRYLPRLDSQTDEEYAAYRARASFFNATARTAEGYLGLIMRRPPFLKVPKGATALAKAMDEFVQDVDLLGNPLTAHAKRVVSEVIATGRAGTLIDWEDDSEERVYASLYRAEQILNWRVERINGRNVPTLVVLGEESNEEAGSRNQGEGEGDAFEHRVVPQIRVLRLERSGSSGEAACVVEVWRQNAGLAKGTGFVTKEKAKWELIESRVPKRLGRSLPQIPFVFHGAQRSQPDVDKLPLADIISVNLDHYRLDADYKHGIHFTALPTAWVSGFDKAAELRIGASTAWVTETPGASAGFLEFTGQGLSTFERAMDRDERLMAVLGSRLLEDQKKVGETATAIELRQSGENSILSNIAFNVSASLTQMLRWAYWWNSTEATPEEITNDQVLMELNTDFSTKGMTSQEIQAVVIAWQAGAISRDTMTELFRRGEVLPEGRTRDEEERLIEAEGSIQGSR